MSLKGNGAHSRIGNAVSRRLVNASTWLNHAPLVLYEAESRGEQKGLWALNFVCESIEQLTGYPSGDFLGESPTRYLYQMIHPSYRRRLARLLDCRQVSLFQVNEGQHLECLVPGAWCLFWMG